VGSTNPTHRAHDVRVRTWFCLVVLAACSSSDPAKPDAELPQPDAAGPLALGPLMPQAIALDASAVMATPTVMPITFDVDANRGDIETFFPQYAASSAWADQTAMYGVGPLTIATPQHVSTAPVTTDAMAEALIRTNTSGATPAWGAASASTLYSIFIPESTTFDDGTGDLCCQDYDGYHDDFMVGGVDVAYAIHCVCPNFPPPGVTALQELTTTAGHETVEAATDPHFETDEAFDDVDAAHEAWTYVTGGELADLCEYADTAYWTDAPGMTYTIQRTWSNAAAAAGMDPCVAGAPATYVQGVPEQPDSAVIAPYGVDVTTTSLKVAKNATGTLTVHLAGTGQGPFTVKAFDIGTEFGASSPYLTFVQPTGTYNVGDTVTISVTVKASDPGLGSSAGAEAFEIDTVPASGPTTYYWGLVSQ
jgi:hypothetical protein